MTRTINGITVELRSVTDLIQLCPENGCGWFELRDGIPSWPEHPMGGTYDNVKHLVASGARQILHREYPQERDREIAVQDRLRSLIRAWEPELHKLFPRVDWNKLDLDDVIAEVEAEEGLQPAIQGVPGLAVAPATPLPPSGQPAVTGSADATPAGITISAQGTAKFTVSAQGVAGGTSTAFGVSSARRLSRCGPRGLGSRERLMRPSIRYASVSTLKRLRR